MPPRKSDVANKTGDEGTPVKETKVPDGVNIEDLGLPKSIVARLAKGNLPVGTQIQGNAMLALSKSATVFVNHLANAANGDALRSGKKTITPQNVLAALEEVEFAEFLPRLEAELAKFNEIQAEKRNNSKKKAADKAADVEPESVEGERAVKKPRMDADDDEMAAGNGEAVDEVADEDAQDDEEEEVADEEEVEDLMEPVDPLDEEDARILERDFEDDEFIYQQQKLQQKEDEALDNGEDSD